MANLTGRFQHLKSGKIVEVIGGPSGIHNELRLRHASGRETNKMLHYFIEEYQRVFVEIPDAERERLYQERCDRARRLFNDERIALMADVATELTDERDLMEDAARLTESDDKVNSVLGAGPLVRPSTMAVHDLAAMRVAILTILDDGCNCESGEKHPWEFYEDMDGLHNLDAFTDEMATEQRMRFADAVEKYLVEQRSNSNER